MSVYIHYEVTLHFSNNLPDRSFRLYAKDPEGAIKVAKMDAQSFGYRILMCIGHTLEVLDVRSGDSESAT